MKLYTAVRDMRVHSHLIHDADRQRLQQRMVCPQDEAVVDQEQTIKGYEIEEDRYVVVDPPELEVLEPEASRDIEVMEFVGAGKVDARYLDRTYFLGPDQDEQMYVNLAESLKQTGLAGMCRWVMRGKSYLGVLEQRDGSLSLITHRYADEVLPADSLEVKRVEPTKKETTIIMQRMKADYNPAHYVNEQRERVLGYRREKAKQQGTVAVAAPEGAEEQPVEQEEGQDLVTALEESLARARRR